ncbi:AAA family ATPase [Gordonia sp. VNK21]|uniref:bifunctional aminoglycoside phosphotransferase/ATP-binding protein n=1 Tax=Gordonia sp. VNK21 TaxID=3382483 RepID=UPI0038D516C3
MVEHAGAEDDPAAAPLDLLRRAGLLDPSGERHVVTHGAVIVLTGDRAWKFKRPVTYRYLDFSTVARRRDALTTELRLNRRTAPELYLGVHSFSSGPDGTEILDSPEVLAGDAPADDYALEMVRFGDDALLAQWADAGVLTDDLLTRIAARVADLHTVAEVSEDHAGAARLLDVIDGNLLSMQRFPEILPPARAVELTDRLRALLAAQAPLLDDRAARGRVLLGHGDLHLRNIAVLDGEPTLFDCLEFDPELATADVLYDLAFLLMDLWARGLQHAANVVMNAYLDRSPADEDGLLLLPLMLSVRATVRAHVCAAEGDADAAGGYLDLALTLTDPVPPRLIAVAGASGTGKSTLARAVGGEVGAAPGARILRSDVLRKRLAGVPATRHLPAERYTPEASAEVYDELRRLAAQNLSGGMSVIADAVSGRPDERAGLAAVAAATGAPFTGIWLELPEAERIERIERRGPDASDADAAVARAQTTALCPPGDDWAHVPADAGATAAVRTLLSPTA